MPVLLLNAGSSSLKGTLMASFEGNALAQGSADWADEQTQYRYNSVDGVENSEVVPWKGHSAAVRRFVQDLRHTAPVALLDAWSLTAIGHRIVHGGEFRTAIRVTPEVRSRIAALAELAPLHNPPSLDTLAAAEELLPDVPHVAAFDTAFHTTLPPEAYTYPVPDRWTRAWGIRRYGFHGLSHAYCSLRAAEMLERPLSELRTIICHLGHGCSAAAVQGGRCIDTTMGFTPLDGLMMATRSGSIDPAIVTHVQQRHGLSADEIDTALNRESGLLGVSGVSGDMRQILAASQAGNERARLALEIYTHRVRQTIGAFTATLGGVDALVFTAGVGEHAAEVRRLTCVGLDCLGLHLDMEANYGCRPDADIASPSSRSRILVIATHEELAMLREMRQIIGGTDRPPAESSTVGKRTPA